MANDNSEIPEEVVVPISTQAKEQSPKMGLQQNDELEPNLKNHSHEISSFTPSPNVNKPPIYLTPELPFTRRRSMKHKTRFGEPSIPLDSPIFEKIGGSPHILCQTLKEKDNECPDDKEIYRRVTAQLSAKYSWRMTVKLVLELFVFLVILSCLICSLTIEVLKSKLWGGLEIWKWFALLLVVFSGMLVTGWFVHCIVFFIEWKFLLMKNVVYFTHGLQNTVQVFLWIAVVLITWVVLFKHDLKTAPKMTSKMKSILDFITWTIATLLIGSFLWLIKNTLIKILASYFHLNRFFERIQEAVFHHYVLQTLSGPPKGPQKDRFGSRTERKVVDWAKLHQMKKEKVPSYTMKLLADVISDSGLSTMSSIHNKDVIQGVAGVVALDDDEITCEEEAIATAFMIFYNVIGEKNQSYIDSSDLLRFMIWEEVKLIYPLFEHNDKGQVDIKSFTKWVVKVYKARKVLKHALNDNKTVVDEFNKLLNGILIVIIIVLGLLLTEVVTTKIILFFSSQFLVAGFMFGNTCKTTFEAIIFVFVMHPFDVGDRCVIDGNMMIVEEMNILTTVFLKIDKEKLYYPNSVLATKAIGNYYRSPNMGDALELEMDYTTPLSMIADLKQRIKKYVDETPQYWYSEHNLVIKELENVSKIKMALYFTHTMNFQDLVEKDKRRTELVLELKKIFDELQISYHLLPQEINLTTMA